MTRTQPRCLILAGPNGAGKSTHASKIVSGLHGIDRFINADTIAAGIGGSARVNAGFEAGRIALQQIDHAIDERADVAFELRSRVVAGRSYWIDSMRRAMRRW